MSEIIIADKNELTSIVDGIRRQTGTTATMSPAQMASKAIEVADELEVHEDLIAQIATALEGKASGGSGGGSIETCTVRFELDGPAPPALCYCFLGTEDNHVFHDVTIDGSYIVKKNSIIVSPTEMVSVSSPSEYIAFDVGSKVIRLIHVKGDCTITYEG